MSYRVRFDSAPTIEPNTVRAGETFRISYAVSNRGDETPRRVFVGYQIRNRYDASVGEDAHPIDDLAPGQGSSYTFSDSLSAAGEYRVRVVADPADQVGGITGGGQGDSQILTLTVQEGG